MRGPVLADFTTEFIPDSRHHDQPIQGRVLLGPDQLVLAASESQRTIPLSAIFDIAIGYIPPDVTQLFNQTVTIGYDHAGTRATAIVQGDTETIDQFVTVLFKAELNGTQVSVRHPARCGGRVTAARTRRGVIKLRDQAVAVKQIQDPFVIELSTVIDFTRCEREFGDELTQAIEVQYLPAEQSITTEFALRSPRKLQLFGRFLRREYSNLLAEVRDLDITKTEAETLVAIYSVDAPTDLTEIHDLDSPQLSSTLDALETKGLLAQTDRPTLTAKGRLAVTDRLNDALS